MNRLCVLTTTSFVALLASAAFADWRQFRGTDGSGIAEAGPKKLDAAAWKVKLPGRGLSGPIVVGDKVILTASSGVRQDRLHVICFDAKSGKQQWERKFWATGRTQCHPKMCNATPQPASDGKRIFAFFSSNDLVCLDLDGNLQWVRGLTHDYPNASNSLGMSSSPVVVNDTLVVQVESDADSFAFGINTQTGISRWKKTRPQRANWTSPSVFRGKQTLALLQSSKGVMAVEPKTGKEVWNFTEGASTIPTSVVSKNMIYVPSNGITALRPVGGGSTPEIVWQASKLRPGTASPLAYRDKIYTLTGGILRCGNAKNGKVEWQIRLQGKFSGTPLAAGGHLYCVSEKGEVVLVDVSGEGKGKVVTRKKLGETVLCTPALSDGALYVRSDGHLWKFAK